MSFLSSAKISGSDASGRITDMDIQFPSHPSLKLPARFGLVSVTDYGSGGGEIGAVLRSSEDDLPPSALAWPAREVDSRVPGAGVRPGVRDDARGVENATLQIQDKCI